ncbi:MAG: hypothetical protein IPL84_15090 [Chitinophagaceae bacterium]|nr:hypothetical protein [Chitinophagaceae bacterium]
MLKSFFKRQATNVQRFLGTYDVVKVQSIQQEREYDRVRESVAKQYPGSLALFGHKVYSQTDEDGIIEEIFNRIPNNKRFLEIGIQTGIECNTLHLLLQGWKGTWVEGSEKYCKIIADTLNGLQFKNKLQVVNSFIDRDNILDIFKQADHFFASSQTELDFFSLDIDGNDFYIMEQLLVNGYTPKVVCVEYNAKFRPPLDIRIKYNKTHVWDGTDYQGCSLQSYINLFAAHQYSLVCCNIPGNNAFFVRNEYATLFTLYNATEFYQPCRYHLCPITLAHKPSLHYLKAMLEEQTG